MKNMINLNSFSIIIALTWTILISISLTYNIKFISSKQNRIVLEHAKNAFAKDMMFRSWIAMHGGVYVPITKETLPNPYLAHIPNRDIESKNGVKLTLMNPAYSLRELMDKFSGMYGEKGHITSLNLLNPNNKADEWETKVLQEFQKKEINEYHEIYNYKGSEHLRYMQNLFIEPDCLKCHSHQGYKLGDSRGGVSITIPMQKYSEEGMIEKERVILWHILIYFCVLIIGFILYKKISQFQKKEELILKEKQEKERMLIEQSKMASMGEMLGNIAHQWRQPLSAISSASTGVKIQKEMNILKDEDLHYSMDVINNSAQYLSSTIEDFRSFFDPRNNKETEFSIIKTIEKTLNLVKHQFSAKEIEIIKTLENNTINSLENELIQVLVNILNNSRDALLEVQNQRRLIFINSYKKEDVLIIEIKDNAKGIPEHLLDRIFEPYFTTKHQSSGTGIGLYMSHSIVYKHLQGLLIASNETYTYDGINYTGAKFTIKININ